MSTRGCGSGAGHFLATPSLRALPSFRVAAVAPATDGVRRGGGGGPAEVFFKTLPLATLMAFLRRASSRRISLRAEDERYAMRAGMVAEGSKGVPLAGRR